MSTTTLMDCIDEFDNHNRTAQSLVSVLEMQILDLDTTCKLEVNDARHPVQQMHALIVALQHQLQEVEKIVYAMPAVAKAA